MLEAAEALLFYAGVEQDPGAIETGDLGPHDPALNASLRIPDADAARARIDKHGWRLTELISPADPRSTVSGPSTSLRRHSSHHDAVLQTNSRPALTKTSTTQSRGSGFSNGQLLPDSRLPTSDHAATYIKQWDSARAALSSISNTTAVNVPATQHTIINRGEPGEAAEASTPALSAPISAREEPNDVDVVMGNRDAQILDESEPRRSEAKPSQQNPSTTETKKVQNTRVAATESSSALHIKGGTHERQRGGDGGGQEISKKRKASSDGDVVDARKRNSKKQIEQINSDDDEVEFVSESKVHSNKTTRDH